jgi:SAM-dependent methyltransferase
MTDRDHQRRWHEADAVAQFSDKSASDFFRSETHFLARIAAGLDSVLDVGCAAGRFIELLRHYGADPDFTGIDISPASLMRARARYPGARFIEADALDCALDRTFTLVNATGVCQHEPRFEALIERMLAWSSRYVLFDVKLARRDRHLIDIERAYCGTGDRLYYIVLSPERLLDRMQALPGLAAISVFGYETLVNARTVVPEDLGPVVSAGILLEKGTADRPTLRVELPGFLAAR